MHTIDVPAQRQLVGDAMLRREQGDLEGFLDLFHPDCEIAFPGTEIRGIEAWRRSSAPTCRRSPTARTT
jgi:ketosteroid isomerase-like protein